MNNSVFAAMTVAAILVFTALHSNSFAHVSYQQRYNDRYSAGSEGLGPIFDAGIL
jgi:hypothetical protein